MCAAGSLCRCRWVRFCVLSFQDIPLQLVFFFFFSAKLEGCILGRGTKVGSRAELVRCLTQAGYEVDAGGTNSCVLARRVFVFCFVLFCFFFLSMTFLPIATIRNEKLEVSDWMARRPQRAGFEDVSSEDEESEEE